MSLFPADRSFNSVTLRRLLQKRFRLPTWKRYVGGFAIVLVGIVVRLALLQALGNRLTYLTLYPAVMVAAFIGGFGPGVLAAFVAAAAVALFWSNVDASGFHDPTEWLGMAIFLLSSVLMAGIAEVSRRARLRVEERTAELTRSNQRLLEEVGKRELADQRLQESDERFRLASLSDEIVLYEQDTALRYTWLYPDDHSRQQAIGRTDLERFGGTEAEILWQRKSEVLKTGVAQRFEARITSEGRVRYFDTFVLPRRAPDGTITGVAGTILDITQRKQAEENRRLLAAIVESSDDAIIGVDLEGTILTWNQGAARMFGYESEEMLGRPISVIQDPARGDEHILEQIRGGERIDHFETRRTRKDGSSAEISLTVSPVRNDLGIIVGASKIAREITERVRSERIGQFLANVSDRLASVEYAEDILRLATAMTGEYLGAQRCYFAEWDEAAGHLTVPQDWHTEKQHSIRGEYELTEFGPREWRQQMAVGLIMPDVDREPLLHDFHAGYGALGIRSFIASGMIRNEHSVISLVAACSHPRPWRRDELQLLKHVAERVWPLAERARSERALRRNERQLRLITDNAPVLLAHLDQARRFKFVNKTYAALYKKTAEEITGAHLADIVGHESYAVSKPHLDRAFAGQRTEFEVEVFPGDTTHWLHVIYTPEESVTGEIVGVMALLTDITARKQTEHEVALARDLAVAASRAKDEFLAALSHELRTPLNPVLLLASEAAENMTLPADVRRDFATIRKNVELEARLIDDLLDLTRITRGKLALDQKNIDGHAVLQDALSVIRPDVDEKRIVLSVDLAATKTLLFADAVRLQQVFWNILKNAVKFTPAGGRINVRTKNSPADSKFVLTVQDTGIGMTAAELERVFNAFAQGDHAGGGGSHRFGGVGLGLTISRMLVERQSGTLDAKSSGPGQGSTFVIELPLASTAAVKGRGQPTVETRPPPFTDTPLRVPSRRVLVVEDHAPTREAVASLLRRRNYEVLTAASVGEARTRMQEGGVRLLVSDIGLPDGDGCELMAELRDNIGLKGIALTGYGMEADVARSAKAGFLAHLTKPIRVQALDAALTAAWTTIEPPHEQPAAK